MGLAADGRRIEQDLGALQRHRPGTLGEPLVPADPHADGGIAGLPYLEAGIPRVEVVLLVVTGAIGNVALAVHTQIAAIGVDNGDTVETRPAAQLEEADRQYHFQLFGNLLEMGNRRILV